MTCQPLLPILPLLVTSLKLLLHYFKVCKQESEICLWRWLIFSNCIPNCYHSANCTCNLFYLSFLCLPHDNSIGFCFFFLPFHSYLLVVITQNPVCSTGGERNALVLTLKTGHARHRFNLNCQYSITNSTDSDVRHGYSREGLFAFALEFSIIFSFSIRTLGVNLLSCLRKEKTNSLNIKYAICRQLVPKMLNKGISVKIFQISLHTANCKQHTCNAVPQLSCEALTHRLADLTCHSHHFSFRYNREKGKLRVVRQFAFPEKGEYSAKTYTGREEMLRNSKQFILQDSL